LTNEGQLSFVSVSVLFITVCCHSPNRNGWMDGLDEVPRTTDKLGLIMSLSDPCETPLQTNWIGQSNEKYITKTETEKIEEKCHNGFTNCFN